MLNTIISLFRQLWKDYYQIVPNREEIPVDKLGLAFNAQPIGFGSVKYQLLEMKGNLGINLIRFGINWTDDIQPTEASAIDWTKIDEVINNLPKEMKVVCNVFGFPRWAFLKAADHGVPVDKIFAEQFLSKVVERYKDKDQIIGYQVLSFIDIRNLVTAQCPGWYLELLKTSHKIIKDVSPNKFVINAGTNTMVTREVVEFNRQMVKEGLLDYVDIFAASVFTSDYAEIIRKDGMADFLNSINKPVWIFDFGESNWNTQLEYAERTLPFLFKHIKSLEKVFWHQFISAYPDISGLKVLADTVIKSDLYESLRNRYLAN